MIHYTAQTSYTIYPSYKRYDLPSLQHMGGDIMDKLALWVRLDAKPGKEQALEDFLNQGLSIVQNEPATNLWFALRLNQSSFGIFDTFSDENGRNAHLTGEVAKQLMAKANELLAKPPQIEKIDIIAMKS